MSRKKAFALRINDEIFGAVQQWADDELRSVNGQIEYLLRDALREAGRLKPQPPEAEQSTPPNSND
ncbi:MAG: Arc family DNA binding domain-containing protein [Lysobacterales bacterium]